MQNKDGSVIAGSSTARAVKSVSWSCQKSIIYLLCTAGWAKVLMAMVAARAFKVTTPGRNDLTNVKIVLKGRGRDKQAISSSAHLDDAEGGATSEALQTIKLCNKFFHPESSFRKARVCQEYRVMPREEMFTGKCRNSIEAGSCGLLFRDIARLIGRNRITVM
ncbi:hypothetical protein TNCV_4734051 [Trichonephila clavipes]|nr:hypothetical protein TNCV_4734051 [Trichonephila clavipes]